MKNTFLAIVSLFLFWNCSTINKEENPKTTSIIISEKQIIEQSPKLFLSFWPQMSIDDYNLIQKKMLSENKLDTIVDGKLVYKIYLENNNTEFLFHIFPSFEDGKLKYIELSSLTEDIKIWPNSEIGYNPSHKINAQLDQKKIIDLFKKKYHRISGPIFKKKPKCINCELYEEYEFIQKENKKYVKLIITHGVEYQLNFNQKKPLTIITDKFIADIEIQYYPINFWESQKEKIEKENALKTKNEKNNIEKTKNDL